MGGVPAVREAGRTDGQTEGRTGGWEERGTWEEAQPPGASGCAHRENSWEIFLRPCRPRSRLSATGGGPEPGPVPGGRRPGREPGSGAPTAGRGEPRRAPGPAPLRCLGALRAGASPVNCVLLLICSPFRSSGSPALSLPPSEKFPSGSRASPPGWGRLGARRGVGAILSARALCH